MRPSKTETETLPPAAPDAQAADFEAAISKLGEDRVRFELHLARLASLFGKGAQ